MTKLAFLISAHTDPAHLRRLAGSLPQGSEFYIHIDAKSDISPFKAVLTGANVHFINHRVNVVWGSINEVEYQMELIRAALADNKADWLISMSGLDYPLWSNERMLDFFQHAQAENREFLQGISMLHQGKAADNYRQFRFLSGKPWKKGSLPSKMRVAIRKAIGLTPIRKSLTIHTAEKTYTLYKGAAWWAIGTALAQHILKEWDGNKPLVRYFKTSFCPAETFIQTVAFNSEFAPHCMLATGKYQSLAVLTPLTYIYYNPTIKILTEEDFGTLQASGKMFCRKVVSGQSDKLMDMIDEARKDD